jgi:hypothetical protein
LDEEAWQELLRLQEPCDRKSPGEGDEHDVTL